ncbi:MAG: hypothetical protein ACKOA9_11660 [Actinomycetota bacterium]
MERSPESRLEATIAIVVAVALMAALPDRVANHPRWAVDVVAFLLAIVLLLATRGQTEPHRGLRVTGLVLTGLLTLVNLAAGARLVVDLTRGQGIRTPSTLLLTGGAIWLTNVIVFSLWYWELDRGGRVERAASPHDAGGHDFLFPQWTAEPPFGDYGWNPTFVDYLYMAFTNATAFSPTDVMPLSRWAKMAMMVQSALSIGIIVLVVARAVNILD